MVSIPVRRQEAKIYYFIYFLLIVLWKVWWRAAWQVNDFLLCKNLGKPFFMHFLKPLLRNDHSLPPLRNLRVRRPIKSHQNEINNLWAELKICNGRKISTKKLCFLLIKLIFKILKHINDLLLRYQYLRLTFHINQIKQFRNREYFLLWIL